MENPAHFRVEIYKKSSKTSLGDCKRIVDDTDNPYKEVAIRSVQSIDIVAINCALCLTFTICSPIKNLHYRLGILYVTHPEDGRKIDPEISLV